MPIRRWGVLSALVIGSMAPDIPYFLSPRLFEDPRDIGFGHTPLGLLLFCLPASLFFLWLWHSVLAGPVVALLPEGLQKRISLSRFDWGLRGGLRFPAIVGSVLL